MNKSVFNLGFDPAILNAMPVPFVIGENGPELRIRCEALQVGALGLGRICRSSQLIRYTQQTVVLGC